eukprot:11181002-Lingulodinium_polyedra.AAC.1
MNINFIANAGPPAVRGDSTAATPASVRDGSAQVRQSYSTESVQGFARASVCCEKLSAGPKWVARCREVQRE